MASSGASNSANGGAGVHQDRALAEMINGLKEESINRGATALMDEDVGSFGVPNPRILFAGCGGGQSKKMNKQKKTLLSREVPPARHITHSSVTEMEEV